MAERRPAKLAEALADNPPVTIRRLQDAIGGASRGTTYRFLREVPYVRSYNHNCRFYIPRGLARFDRHGLFFMGDIRFSRDGNLAATVQRMAREAEDGHTQRELQNRLHVYVHSFLLLAVRQGKLRRERLGTAWVYLSDDPAVARVQWQARQRRAAREAAEYLDPKRLAEVLLVLIRHPGSSPAEVVARLREQVRPMRRRLAPPIRLQQVKAVFRRYELDQPAPGEGAAGS